MTEKLFPPRNLKTELLRPSTALMHILKQKINQKFKKSASPIDLEEYLKRKG